MTSHSDRAVNFMVGLLFTDDDNVPYCNAHGTFQCDKCISFEQVLCRQIAAEFEAALPAGSVAVDRKMLREALESGAGEIYGTVFCNYPECIWESADDGGMTVPNTPHSPDCPLGGDDA